MTIVDEYIRAWVTHDELEAIRGLDVAIATRVFMIGGKVVAESPGIGLWTELEFVAAGDPAETCFRSSRTSSRGVSSLAIRTGGRDVRQAVEKFREKYGAADVKKYYSKFDVAVRVPLR